MLQFAETTPLRDHPGPSVRGPHSVHNHSGPDTEPTHLTFASATPDSARRAANGGLERGQRLGVGWTGAPARVMTSPARHWNSLAPESVSWDLTRRALAEPLCSARPRSRRRAATDISARSSGRGQRGAQNRNAEPAGGSQPECRRAWASLQEGWGRGGAGGAGPLASPRPGSPVTVTESHRGPRRKRKEEPPCARGPRRS